LVAELSPVTAPPILELSNALSRFAWPVRAAFVTVGVPRIDHRAKLVTAVEFSAQLLVDKILLPDLPKFLQFIPPVLRDSARILPCDECVVHTLIHQQGLHLLDLEIGCV
jgi:hypothetical protein